MTDVKRLLKEATPLPWREFALHREPPPGLGDAGDKCVVGPDDVSVICWGHNYDEYGTMSDEDQRLMVHAVNSLPAYEAAVEALERLIEFIGAQSNEWQPVNDARAALRHLREEAS